MAEQTRHRTLILVRHAAAARATGSGDAGRPLTPRGWQDARRLGVLLAQRVARVDLAVTSPARRTAETLEALGESLEVGRTEVSDEVYLATPDDLVATARGLRGDVAVVVGHEPSISAAGAELTSAEGVREELARGVRTATAIILEFDGRWRDLSRRTCATTVVRPPLDPSS